MRSSRQSDWVVISTEEVRPGLAKGKWEIRRSAHIFVNHLNGYTENLA